MITKKDLHDMPRYQPFWGPAEAPPNVKWDIFWADTCRGCDLEPFDRMDWEVPGDHPGYPEPEIDHEEQEEALAAGLIQVAGGYDDDDACLAALNEGFTLVKVAYGDPGEEHEGWSRILVCARKGNPTPKVARDGREDDQLRKHREGYSCQLCPEGEPDTICPCCNLALCKTCLGRRDKHPLDIDTTYRVKAIVVDNVVEKMVVINKPVESGTKHVIIEAHSTDEYADGPSFAIIEFTEKVMETIHSTHAVLQTLLPGSSVHLRVNAARFYSHDDLDAVEANIEDFDVDGAFDSGMVIDAPNEHVTEQAMATYWDRLEVSPAGIMFTACPQQTSHIVQTDLITYKRLEELYKGARDALYLVAADLETMQAKINKETESAEQVMDSWPQGKAKSKT